MLKTRKFLMSGYLMGAIVAPILVALTMSGCLFKKTAGSSDPAAALNDALAAGLDGAGVPAIGGSYNSSATALSYGAISHFNTSRPYDIKVTKLSSSKLVVMFRDMATSGRLKAMVGDIVGTAVNFGPKQAIDDNCTSCYMASITTLSSTRIVVAYPDTNNADHGTSRTCDVSGATLTCSANASFSNNSISTGLTSVIPLNSSKFVVSYLDNSSTGKANVGTVAADGTITFGASSNFENGMSMVLQSASALSPTQFVIAYEDGGDMHGKAIVGTVSGTTITFGIESTFSNQAVSLGLASAPLSQSNFVVAYEKQNAAGAALVGSVTGTGATASIIFGAEALFSNNIEQDISVSALASDKFVVSFINNNTMDYGQEGGVATIGKVSGSIITYGWGYRYHTYGFSKPTYAAVASFSDKGFLTLVCDKETNNGAAYVSGVSAL